MLAMPRQIRIPYYSDMDETVTPSSSDSGRLLALFAISAVGLLFALGMDELPFTPASGPLALVAELLYFVILGCEEELSRILHSRSPIESGADPRLAVCWI